MSAINAYKRSAYGVLKDLIEDAGGNKSVFLTYKDKTLVGKDIFKELYDRFQKEEGQRKGFYMDDSGDIGILSQCQSLQALLLLASDFGLEFDDEHLISEEETNFTIREIMDFVIEDVIKRIKTHRPGEYKFDASPYDTGRHFTIEYSNIEAMTWVVASFLQTLQYHAEVGETCKWEGQLVSVISYCLNYFNKAFITSPNVGSSKKLEIGWNFTDKCEEPSLFYSFTVCECYVSFFETFKDHLEYHEAKRNATLGLKMDKALEEAHAAHEAAKEKALAKDKPGKNEKGKQIARFDPYNELANRFSEINNGEYGITPDSPYGMFEANCKALAKEVWRLTKETLADKFFYNDLETTLSDEDISIATTSDALFNTVYIINILLDAGLDEDLVLQRKLAEDDEATHEAEREYNNLFESCQVASQKAFRMYEKLKTQGKEYIVEQFLIGFNENFTVHKDKVKELRKLRMRVFTLMPLLIRTNNVISEYLIKYPQVNMRKYLGYILENRYEEKNKFKWIWESDGFFSCSNYYYVSALGEFYRYYETYELKYIENYTENDASRASIIREHNKELEAPGGTISELKIALKDREEDVAKLQKELAAVETPVEDAVAAVVAKEMKTLLPGMLCEFMMQAAQGLTVNDVDDTPCADEHKAFALAIRKIMLATISKHVYDNVRSGKYSKEENIENHKELEGKVSAEFERCIKAYISYVNDSDEGRSPFFN